MQLPVQSGSRRWTVPAPWNEQSLTESTLCSSPISYSAAKWAQFNPNWDSGTVPQEEAWRGQQLSPRWQLLITGESWFGSAPSWAQGTFTPSTLLFRQIWPKLPHNFESYWVDALKERQAAHSQEPHFLRLTSCKQAASLLPAVHLWPPCPSSSSSPPSVPIQTLKVSRPVWEWWRARSRNRSCWKLTLFFFFKGLFLSWILSQTRLRAWLHNAYVSTRKPSNEHPWGGQDRCLRYPRHLNELVKQQPPDSRLKSHRASVNWGWHIKNQKNKTRNSYTQVT